MDFDSVIAPVVSRYFTADSVEKMKFIYVGMNLKYVDLLLPKMIEPGQLQYALNPLKINLKF